MENVTSLSGPIEIVNGQLALRIPLAAGGDALAASARGIGVVEGEFLTVAIPPWLSEKLGVVVGSIVRVNNANGKFNIHFVQVQPH